MALVGHPYRRQLAGTQQLRQVLGVAPVGLDAIAGLGRDQRWRHHDALVPEALDQTVEAVARRARLVAQRQPAILGAELGNQLAARRAGRVELAEIVHLPATPALRDSHGILQLRGINADEKFAIVSHDSPSLCEALPGPSG